ncbi:carbohydrate sulfotransferase 15-like [Octopus vulgaris]|uniref:Carbohydrate sulfotransferase 15-like n=1 Tax=Octopus vulgaris TaxID=6645 RepID=A0AA36ALZ0_OCTVU|nr:carbohydrate sulfotransferase 15-like [Octopus vulgaris]
MIKGKKVLLFCILSVVIYIVFIHNISRKPFQAQLRLKGNNKRIDIVELRRHQLQITKENDLIERDVPRYLLNYRNPCWLETIHSAGVYIDNPYLSLTENTQKEMIRLTVKWGKLLSKTNSSTKPKRLRCLPYVYVAGMPKSGTTDFYRRLNVHPDIVKGQRKEPHWWTRMRFIELKRTNHSSINIYIDLFDGAAEKIEVDKSHSKITSDSSASTLWDNDFWRSFPGNANLDEPELLNAHYIHHFTPDIKIIVLLRNPIERLFSDYLYFGKLNKSVENFHERVVDTIALYENCFKNETLRKCAYDSKLGLLSGVRLRIGLYWVYLKDWFRIFPVKNFLIIRSEDYKRCVLCVFKKVFRFLGLKKLDKVKERTLISLPPANTRKDATRNIGPIMNETYALLQKFYQPHNEELVKLLNRTAFNWSDDTLD